MKEIIVAFGLFLYIEGSLYALFPTKMRNMLEKLKLMKDAHLRFGGAIFALVGFLIISYMKVL